MSRASGRPASRKGSAKSKVKKKTPKQQIAELTEQNTALTTELDTVKTEAAGMSDKIDTVTNKLVNNVKRQDFGLSDDIPGRDVSNATLVDIIDRLVVRRQIHETSVEERVEALEGRVTDMTQSLAKMTTKTAAYEMGLQDLTHCDSLDTVKDKVYKLQLIAGKEYHTFDTNDPLVTEKDVLNGYHDSQPNSATKQSLVNAHQLNLNKPTKKSPGETLIRNMHKDLRLYVIQELSLEKPSGGDWRRFAERVGIPSATVEEWRAEKLTLPMGRVLDTWAASPGATVRQLHRHLVSPQLRCTLVAKRVSDFYVLD